MINPRIQTIVEASHALFPLEKLELIQQLSRDLHEAYALEVAAAEFWTAHTLSETVSAQSTPVITDSHTLIADFWPSDESADDINDFIAQRRAAGRASKMTS